MMKFYALTHRFNQVCYDETDEQVSKLQKLAAKRWSFIKLCCYITSLLSPIYFQLPAWKRHKSLNSSNRIEYGAIDLYQVDVERYAIRFHLPFNLGTYGIPCSYRAYVVHSFILIMMINGLIKTSTYMSFANELTSWQEKQQFNKDFRYDLHNATIRCIRLDSLSELDRVDVSKIYNHVQQLKLAGLTVISMNDLIPFINMILSYLYLVFIFYAFSNRDNSDFIMNPVTFHHKPMIERQRLQMKLGDLSGKISFYLNNAELNESTGFLKRLRIDFGTPSDKYHEYCRYSLKNRHKQSVSKRDFMNLLDWLWTKRLLPIHNFSNVTPNDFNNLTKYSKQAYRNEQKLLPAHLTLSSYKQIMKDGNCFISCWIASIVIVFAISLSGLLYREVTQRIEQRFEQLECNRWHPQGLSRKWLSIFEDFTNLSHELAYRRAEHNYSSSAWLELAVEVELPLMLNQPYIIVPSIFIALQFIMIETCFGVYVICAALNHSSKSIWLAQICRQLNLIRHMMDELNLAHYEIGIDKSNISLCKKQIEQALELSYINFILFQKESRSGRNYLSFVILQLATTAIGSVMIVLCLLVSSNDETKSNRIVIWSMVIMFIMLFDIYFIMSVSSTIKIHRLFGDVNMIMAKSTQVSMANSLIMSLWRRQMMTRNEIEAVFGTQTFGFDLTYSNFIQFNSYVLGGSL